MGAWQEVAISYRDVEGHYCACCGKQVPRYIFVENVGGTTRRFCGPDCADLYEWYWLPRHGSQLQGSQLQGSRLPAVHGGGK